MVCIIGSLKDRNIRHIQYTSHIYTIIIICLLNGIP